MSKAYWVTCYSQIIDPEKLAAYAKLAAPAIPRQAALAVLRGAVVRDLRIVSGV